ncbi:AAA family ATPase [Sphingobacterium siyangense]|uniref:AAA family ATPase n=1 Tax=Sphingobacterium siyangense TaxID=459529 RepID=UPI002FDAE375
MAFPVQNTISLNIEKLKGITNLNIDFGPKPLTAIMGVNGCGKTTILHALACCYKPYNGNNSKNHLFSEYFTPNTDSKWAGSKFTLHYNHELATARHLNSREYKKDADRWSPRYDTRLPRYVAYIGVRDAVPAIEELKTKSFIALNKTTRTDVVSKKIISDASVIMNRDYSIITKNTKGKNNYVGVQYKGNHYSAISMGSGEQRIFKILEILHNAPNYSLILIDEIELLLHTGALKRLINILHREAVSKNFQIVFTTHAEAILELPNHVSVNHIFNATSGDCLCFKDVNPQLLYALTDNQEKSINLFVEDSLSKEIVIKIASDLGIRKHIEIGMFGAAINSFTAAAGVILSGEDISNCLFIIDGDLYRKNEEKQDRLNKVLTGTDENVKQQRLAALNQITQFALPEGISPEKYFHTIISALGPLQNNGYNEIVNAAKDINAVPDNHNFIDDIIYRLGFEKDDYREVVNLLSTCVFWEEYSLPIRDWLLAKKAELNLN